MEASLKGILWNPILSGVSSTLLPGRTATPVLPGLLEGVAQVAHCRLCRLYGRWAHPRFEPRRGLRRAQRSRIHWI
jgi:hypothetical protein